MKVVTDLSNSFNPVPKPDRNKKTSGQKRTDKTEK